MFQPITLAQYLMGRDALYPKDFTAEIHDNAIETLRRWNWLLEEAWHDGIELAAPQVASGWRPLAVNDATSNAAGHSKHITAQAMDGHDDAHRTFARWCLANLELLRQIGLWMERPQWTPTWVHLGCLPPASGHRIYVPSTAPALCLALPGELELAFAN